MEMTMETKVDASMAARWYRQRWPWLLMAGPALAIAAGAYTSWLAFAHQDALVVGDYYKKGKAINQDLRRDRAAAALGLAVQLRYDAAAGVLHGHLASSMASAGAASPAADASQAATQQQALSLRLSHATQPEHDMVMLAKPDASGNFSVPLPMLERSRWQIVIEGERRDWRLEGEWSWPAEREVRIASR